VAIAFPSSHIQEILEVDLGFAPAQTGSRSESPSFSPSSRDLPGTAHEDKKVAADSQYWSTDSYDSYASSDAYDVNNFVSTQNSSNSNGVIEDNESGDSFDEYEESVLVIRRIVKHHGARKTHTPRGGSCFYRGMMIC